MSGAVNAASDPGGVVTVRGPSGDLFVKKVTIIRAKVETWYGTRFRLDPESDSDITIQDGGELHTNTSDSVWINRRIQLQDGGSLRALAGLTFGDANVTDSDGGFVAIGVNNVFSLQVLYCDYID
jgi:hypothetical protein